MKITLRPYKIEDTQTILDIINFNILHSTALYGSFEQQKNILEEKIRKGFQFCC
jgi:phosphinothricin acetyltransferase